MYSKSYADRVAGAVFLIGLGLLFTPLSGIVGGFFPGILFVIGASTIARGVAEGQPWYEVSGGLFMIGLGAFFLLGFNLPLLLIILGLMMLFGYSFHSSERKSKHDDDFAADKPKHDQFV
jgi:hypothetical protein